MSLWSKTLSVFTGVDLDAEQQRSNQLDAQILANNQKEVDRGQITQQEADRRAQVLAAADAELGVNDVVGSVSGAFGEGLKEGAQNVLEAPGKAAAAITGAANQAASGVFYGIIKNIPWWAWLVGLGALFVWMGGLSLVRGRLAK